MAGPATQDAFAHESWSTKVAFLFAVIGSAVGLGNIWRFPTVTGDNGGGAFVLVYIACVIIIGAPIVMSELLLGRRGRGSPIGSMRRITRDENRHPAWTFIGWLGVLAPFLALWYYSTIGGWSLEYLWRTASGYFEGITSSGSEHSFKRFMDNPVRMMIWHAVFMGVVVYIIARGIRGGLEKAVTWLMPMLFFLLIFLVGYGAFTADFSEALNFLFKPDFGRLTGDSVLQALGQAFFSLSIGVGALMTYGAYLEGQVNMPRMVGVIVSADTMVALLAGLAVFPLVFAYSLDVGAGPGLIFQTLPIAFGQMPAGVVFGSLFFLLLSVAAITSAISMLEPVVSYLEEHKGFKRAHMAIIVGLLATLGGVGSVLSFNELSDFYPLSFIPALKDATIFDSLDYVVANFLMTIGGFFVAFYAGWLLSKEGSRSVFGSDNPVLFKGWLFLARFLCPVAVAVIFLNNLGLFDQVVALITGG